MCVSIGGILVGAALRRRYRVSIGRRRASEGVSDRTNALRGASVPIAELSSPRIRSPSQWPGTARSAASAGRSLTITSVVTNFFPRACVRARGIRSARPVRRQATSSRLSARIEAERAAEAARRAAEERERMWHALMRQAEEQLVESKRADRLLEQSDSWHRAEALRRYCDAMEVARGARAETVASLAWARTYVQQLDPLSEVPAMPESPEVTPEALQEHLPDGWSARGPEHGRM